MKVCWSRQAEFDRADIMDAIAADNVHAVVAMNQLTAGLSGPHAADTSLDDGYQAMAADRSREADAKEWCNTVAGPPGQSTLEHRPAQTSADDQALAALKALLTQRLAEAQRGGVVDGGVGTMADDLLRRSAAP